MIESEKDAKYETTRRFSDRDEEELDAWVKDMEENQKLMTRSVSAIVWSIFLKNECGKKIFLKIIIGIFL